MSLGAAAAIVYAARPADEDHAFGHTSAEDLAALAQAIFILVVGGGDRLGGRRAAARARTVALASEGLGHGGDGWSPSC